MVLYNDAHGDKDKKQRQYAEQYLSRQPESIEQDSFAAPVALSCRMRKGTEWLPKNQRAFMRSTSQ
jgi:hypothetical protein